MPPKPPNSGVSAFQCRNIIHSVIPNEVRNLLFASEAPN